MSGHSKWSTIKHKKGALDAQRGKVFSQLSKNIRLAVKQGKSGDVQANPMLRLAVEKARAANMPKEKIQKAIDRGLGKSATGGIIQEIVYEAFGPQGVGLVIVAMSDNSQRTSANVRFVLSRGGGALGSPGSVMYMFTRNDDGEYTPSIPMPLEDPEVIQQLETLMDTLREDEEVEDVFTTGVWENTQES